MCVFNKPRSFWLTIKEGPQTIHTQTEKQTVKHTHLNICFGRKVPKKGLNVLVWFWVWIALVNLLIMSSSSSFSFLRFLFLFCAFFWAISIPSWDQICCLFLRLLSSGIPWDNLAGSRKSLKILLCKVSGVCCKYPGSGLDNYSTIYTIYYNILYN